MGEQGAPTKYKSEYDDLAYNYSILGATDAQMADFFGVTEQTVNNWKIHFPSFFESIKRGKHQADAKVAQSLYKKACGGYLVASQKAFVDKMGEEHVIDVQDEMPPDTTAAIFWLKNRQPEIWRDKSFVENNNIGELTINGNKFAE